MMPDHEMIALRDRAIRDQEIKYPSPMPLWKTPWYVRLLGYPAWRFYTPARTWHYLPDSEYRRLFTK